MESRESVLLAAEKQKLLAEALRLSENPAATRADLKRADVLLAQAANLKTIDEMAVRAAAAAEESGLSGFYLRETEEQRTARRENEHFVAYLRGEAEKRTYTGLTSNSALVPQDFLKQLLKGIAQYDPLLDENNVRLIVTATGRKMKIPALDLSTISASIIGEGADNPPASNPTVANTLLGGYSYRVDPVAATLELEQDSGLVLKDVLAEAFAIGLARGIGADLVNGNGSTAPNGLLNAASNSGITTGAAGVITATDLDAIYFSVNRAYRASKKCAWVISDEVYEMVRAAKDSSNRPLLSMHDDDEMLLGKKVLVAPSMPSAAGSKGIVFGDLSQYTVRISRQSVGVTRNFQAPGYAENAVALYTCFARVDANLNAPGSTTPVVYATLHS